MVCILDGCYAIETNFNYKIPRELDKLILSPGTKSPIFTKSGFPISFRVLIFARIVQLHFARIVHLFTLNEKPEPSYYFCLPSVLESQSAQIIKSWLDTLPPPVVQSVLPRG